MSMYACATEKILFINISLLSLFYSLPLISGNSYIDIRARVLNVSICVNAL